MPLNTGGEPTRSAAREEEIRMTGPSNLPSQTSSRSDQDSAQRCTLHVCTSCRPPGTPRSPDGSRPGFILYKNLRDAIGESTMRDQVDVRPAECLSVCPRPCGFALSLPEAWTYIFGDQRPVESIAEVLECISLYINSPSGFLPRLQRPKGLRGSILGRIPPIKGPHKCI